MATTFESGLHAPFAGTVIAIAHDVGEPVAAGTALVILEAMKMEHEVIAERDGVVAQLEVEVGDTVDEGQLLAVIAPGDPAQTGTDDAADETDLTAPREDLESVIARHALTLDDARPEAIAKRHERGRRTARENLAELVDEGSFVEYGPLMFAAQERRRDRDELVRRTPADGLVGGVGEIDGHPTVVMSYDYTVLAGTQGMRNHLKKDRLFELAEDRRLPVVLFAEGGGGRPGDVDMPIVAGLDCRAFHLFARLSALVPLVGIASGYCFAGNAALLGCCDVVIATEDSSIGMGGPAMIEGGGLGVYPPQDVGPIDVQYPNGVVDLRVPDDAAAVAAAKRYLTYFTERTPDTAGGHGRPTAGPRPDPPAPSHPDEPQAHLRRPRGHRCTVRRGLGARTPPRLRARDGHRARARRRPSARRDRQRPEPPRRRDRRPRRGQGGPVHAAVRRA